MLSSSFAPSDVVLDRRHDGAGELRGGVAQGIIPRGDRGLHIRLQIAQPTERADDAPADLLDHGGNGGVGRRLTREQAGWAPLVHTSQQYPLQEEDMIVHMGV